MSTKRLAGPSSEADCRRELAEAQARLARAEARLEACGRDADELNHRIANSLQLAASFLLLQQRRLEDETAREALTVASARIGAIARLHRIMAEQGSSPHVDLADLLRRIGPEIASSTGMTCEVDVDPIEVPGETAMQLAVAVNELVINAGKHAYADGDGGVVRIACRREPSDMIRLCVADGGFGLPDGFTPGEARGLGLSILASIVRQLGGELRAETDGGAKFTLRVPLRSR